VGYINQSIVGWQSTDGTNQKYYDAGNRFHSVEAGIALPIFNHSTRSRIKAARVNESIEQLKIEQVKKQLGSEWTQWVENYQKAMMALRYYETAGEQQAKIIASSAQLSFEKGSIDYLQWGLLMNQVINIRLGYLDALKNYNQSAIQLSYYLSK